MLTCIVIRQHWSGDHYETAGFGAMSPVCYKSYYSYDPADVTGTLLMGTHSQVFTTVFTTGLAIYPAWHISWEASDVSNLNPKLPTLTNNMRIPTWLGGDVPKGLWDNDGRGRGLSQAPLLGGAAIAMIGVGVLLFACLVGGFGCFCHKKRKQRKANNLALASSHVTQANEQTPLELATKPIHTS